MARSAEKAATAATISQTRSSASRSRLQPALLDADETFELEPHEPEAPPPPDRPPPSAKRTAASGLDGRSIRPPNGRLFATSMRSLPSSLARKRDHFQRTHPFSRHTKVA